MAVALENLDAIPHQVTRVSVALRGILTRDDHQGMVGTWSSRAGGASRGQRLAPKMGGVMDSWREGESHCIFPMGRGALGGDFGPSPFYEPKSNQYESGRTSLKLLRRKYHPRQGVECSDPTYIQHSEKCLRACEPTLS